MSFQWIFVLFSFFGFVFSVGIICAAFDFYMPNKTKWHLAIKQSQFVGWENAAADEWTKLNGCRGNEK